jgi:cobalt-zinc-cadmium efflux system outer membrane protein
MFRSIRIAAAVVVLAASAVSAQTIGSSDAAPLTLQRAAAEALEKNPQLAALRRDYEAARGAPAQERFLPAPMFETQIWQWPITTLNPIRTEMYMFMAEQELPGRGKRAARALVSERDADLVRQQVPVRASAVLGDLRQAFVDLSLARELVPFYERQAALLDTVAEATAVRYAGGRGAQHHTVATLVELTRLQQERIHIDERIQDAEARLNTLLGRPIAQPVEALAPIGGTVPAEEAERLALERHPQVALAAATVAREEAELARLRGERRPDFVVGGGYMLMPGDAGALTVRGGITWPNAPWSRGRLDASTDVQAKRVEAAKAHQAALATTIRYAVRQAAIRLAAAERQVRLIESTVLPQVEHAFELARVGYTGGEGAFSDVLASQRMLLTAQLDHAEARARVARARAELDSAVGIYE